MDEPIDTPSNELGQPLSSDSAARIPGNSARVNATSDTSAATQPENVADPCGRTTAIETLRRGPIGAVAVASIAVACVLIIWYAFYFFAYVPRT